MVIFCEIVPYNKTAALLAKTVYFFSTALMCYFWFVYFEHMQGSKFIRSRKIAMICSVFVWIMGILLFINWFTGILFYVDGDNVYCRGKYFIVQYILSYIYVIVASLHALVGIFDRRKISIRKTLIYLSLFPIAPAAAGIIQFVRPELPVACAALSVATLIMYLNWTDDMIALDPLTKLSNRKRLMYTYEQWQHQDNVDPMYLMMIDANKFKAINDTYGHVRGDEALVCIARSLILACHDMGERNNIARYGGDEFTILLHTGSEEKVKELKKHISEYLKKLNEASGAPYELTVSVGYVRAERSEDFGKLVAVADEMLYEEKHRLK